MQRRFRWCFFVIALAFMTVARRAGALGNAGIDVGVAQRAINYVNTLPVVFAFGAHAEADVGPLFRVGPYYLHYELPSNDVYIYIPDRPAAWYAKGTFNTLGVRTRFVLPVSGPLKPHASLGVGRTWLTHHLGTVLDVSYSFIEVPIGVGASFEVTSLLSISLDAAYRPAVLFLQTDSDGHEASTGTSLLLGASFAF